MDFWFAKSFGAWLAWMVVAGAVFGVVFVAGVLALPAVFVAGGIWVAREWRAAAPPPTRRSGMQGSRLPETDDYEPGTLTLRR